MPGDAQHCSFVLLAEFDIFKGAQLTYQFPQPLGTDEGLLANLMLPDGAEKHLEDWTIFFLNQTPFNTIAPVLALEPHESDGRQKDGSATELLYVLNLVRTKQDKSLPRGALVKAMAICTRHPFIQIFKPILLMALDDYFADPSQECLSRLFDAVNSMDLSNAPVLTRREKLVMRASERKDVFIEKFTSVKGNGDANGLTAKARSGADPSVDSRSSFEEGILARTRDRDGENSPALSPQQAQTDQSSPSEASFSLGGSAVWVGDDGDHTMNGRDRERTSISTTRNRLSTDASSISSSSGTQHGGGVVHIHAFQGIKDTHFYPTTIAYKGHQLPIKMPLSTFPEEVGDYSLIQLIQTFSTATSSVTGPSHPHLHSNGSLTHPIIVLFNALITGKRIVFLGHNRPAGQVANYVLSACALGSGCGTVLRGFIERAFPYANLTKRDEWESIPGYIAGVTNLIFESSRSWDLLCDVGTGRMVVSKDIHVNFPPTHLYGSGGPLTSRSGTLRAESSGGSEDDFGRNRERSEFVASRADNYDNIFMDDIISAISYHFGEGLVRARFTDYVARFVRLAARYDEELNGSTKMGFPTFPFSERHGDRPRLGSGVVFIDESAASREMMANASRIEAWRKTKMCEYYEPDFQASLASDSIKGIDLLHQLHRLRITKNLPDAEVELMMRSLAENLQSYEQVVELLSLVPPHHGGLLPISFGLFHQQKMIREYTVDIFNELRLYPIGVQFLQALNHFQRYAYVRLAYAREARTAKEMNYLYPPPPTMISRTPSNRSESSLTGG